MGKSIAVNFRRGEQVLFFWKTCFVFLVIAFLGKVSIPLPLTPIPLALRPQLVILCAWVFGMRTTIAALLIFCVGVWGEWPLLVSQGAVGKGLFGPSFGYVFAYFVVAVIVPKLRMRGVGISLSFLFSSYVIEALGALGLSLFIGWIKGWELGFLPFVLGDSVKALIFAGSYRCFTKSSCSR